MAETDDQQYAKLEPSLEEYEAILLLLFGFGAFSVILAILYNAIRKHVFGDLHNLDQSFDAGGRVSTSLTSVTVAVQLLWPADLLQSATVTTKYGLSGGFWYSISIIINIMLFPLLSLEFKTRAPGAKTFLQLIHARFGRVTHIIFCVYALLANLVITATLIVAGAALFQGIIKDISNEMVVILLATLFGSYSFVGGLGSTFYVSYFNAMLTLCVLSYFVIKIFYVPKSELPFGGFDDIYNRIADLTGPHDNEDRSYVTFWSAGSLVWAAQGAFISLGVIFCDQASWQSKVAAKPMQGVLGFFFATLIWFAIPSTLGTSAGLVYLSYSNVNASSYAAGTVNISSVLQLSDADVDAGLVTPFVASLALGRVGGVALIIMFTMLMMSTGSGEVMGVASIIVYDIYQTHVRPFRKKHKRGHCIICGFKQKGEVTDRNQNDEQEKMCCCPSITDCTFCTEDIERMSVKPSKTLTFVHYLCPVHGQYREYQDSLVSLKNWVILWVAICIIPLGVMVVESGIDLNWIFLNNAMIIVPAFPGICLTIMWVKATSTGLILGSFAGLVSGLTASLSRASQLKGGLGNFLDNTADPYTVLLGSGTCLFTSLFVTIVVSMVTHKIKSEKDREREWQKLRDIDNPLRPWADALRSDGVVVEEGVRPTYQQLDKYYRVTKRTTIIGVILMISVFVFIIPGIMASLHTLSSLEFQSWLMSLHIWCFVTSLVVVIATPLEEVKNICLRLRDKRQGLKADSNHALFTETEDGVGTQLPMGPNSKKYEILSTGNSTHL